MVLVFLLLSSAYACKTTSISSSTNDTIKESMVKAMKWQEAHPIHAKAPTDWTNGAYYTGVARAHAATQDKVYTDVLMQMGKRNAWQPWNRFYHADDLAICYSYIYLQSIGAKGVDLQPTDSIIQDHLFKPHEWREGIKGKENLWWWCDALFMAPPVLTTYAKLKNDKSYLDEMHTYFMQTYDLLYDKKENLFARDSRFVWEGDSTDVKEKNGNKVFWSRGNGWVIGGLALMLEDMPADYQHRPFYEKLFKEMAVRIKGLQQPDGLWRTSLLSPESFNHGEVSGSGFHTFALAWGVNTGLLDKAEYNPVVLKAWTALAACQQSDGKVGWVQNIGFDPQPATKDTWQNYGTGAFLLAASEVLKLK